MRPAGPVPALLHAAYLVWVGKILQTASQEMPPETLPRSPGHWIEWVNYAKGRGPEPGSNFQYSGWTTESNHLGNVAYRTGKKIEWDWEKMRATNAPEAAPFIRRPRYRKLAGIAIAGTVVAAGICALLLRSAHETARPSTASSAPDRISQGERSAKIVMRILGNIFSGFASRVPSGGSACFPAGTRVRTADGPRDISKLAAGDGGLSRAA